MRSELVWTNSAWSDYLYWQTQDKKILRRINLLIRELLRHPETGIGKPEKLRGSLSGFWSRRIDDTHRLVYAVEESRIVILACRYHYD